MTFQNLVSVDWLKDHLHDNNLRVIDATFYLPAHQKDAFAEYQRQAIPTAGFFDLDAIKDQSSSLPHMVPSAHDFACAMQDLGVNTSDCIVVYDQHGLFSAARLWWMLKLFGHEQAFVLNGGLPACLPQAYPSKVPDNEQTVRIALATMSATPTDEPHGPSTWRRYKPTRHYFTTFWTPDPPIASTALFRNHGRACAVATSRDRRTCHLLIWFNMAICCQYRN